MFLSFGMPFVLSKAMTILSETIKIVITMSKNEKTSSRVATIASNVLRKGSATPSQARTLAGSVLTQAPDRSHKKK